MRVLLGSLALFVFPSLAVAQSTARPIVRRGDVDFIRAAGEAVATAFSWEREDIRQRVTVSPTCGVRVEVTRLGAGGWRDVLTFDAGRVGAKLETDLDRAANLAALRYYGEDAATPYVARVRTRVVNGAPQAPRAERVLHAELVLPFETEEKRLDAIIATWRSLLEQCQPAKR